VASSLIIDRPSGIDPTLPPCGSNTGVPCVYQRFGPQSPGRRALFAIVGSVDAAADRFPTARLVNHAGTPVAATSATMRSALLQMHTHHDGVTQTDDLQTKSKYAYPLTTVDYAMVPTCGITAAKVTGINSFLHLVTRSQRLGLAPGQLALGSEPLTGAQRAKTLAAARALSSASCNPPKHHTTPPPPAAQSAPVVVPPAPVTTPQPVQSTSKAASKPTKTHTASPTTSATPTPSPSPAAYGYKHADHSMNTVWVLPAVLALILALLVGGPGVVALRGTESGRRAGAQLRRLVRR
jgi:hypothetical protein